MADENESKDAEPKKGELQSAALVRGKRHEAGTKVSDLDLTDDEKARFERLGVIKK
jgi:hypothetical protein